MWQTTWRDMWLSGWLSKFQLSITARQPTLVFLVKPLRLQWWVWCNSVLKTNSSWLAAKPVSFHGFKTNSVQMHRTTYRSLNIYRDSLSLIDSLIVRSLQFIEFTKKSRGHHSRSVYLPVVRDITASSFHLFVSVQLRFIFVLRHLTQKQSNHPEAIWLAFYESCESNSGKFCFINNIKSGSFDE